MAPAIKFPFRHKDHQPTHCGYPGFDLYCDQKNQTVIELPSSVKLLVKNINYKSQEIHVYDQHGCLPIQLPHLNLSASPFQFRSYHLRDYTTFNCSQSYYYRWSPIRAPCLGTLDYQVLAVSSDYFVFDDHLLSCTKIHDISSVPDEIFHKHVTHLQWSYSTCADCEANGKKCRLMKTNNKELETQCFRKKGMVFIARKSCFYLGLLHTNQASKY